MNTWKRRTLMGAGMVTLVGCGGGSEDEPVLLALDRIVQPWSLTTLQESYVLRTEADWQRVWNLHQPATFAPVPLPRVDFNQFMVLGLTLGTGANGCYGLSIQRVLATSSQAVVEYRFMEPGPNSACTLALVPLTDFAVVRRIDGPVLYRRVTS
ncbi:hypothetical protein [Inhella gelatinilytica]|uniref:PrcB C-terminal domain-containing protein n=1 Tax=Inhella gelatinilytica TaxID=2795030 RepID=A0A931NCF3_9BURK|nr:hypothetical protein [Inhella gelatinilytica]MBH9551942.1 hypothetical protein [Inhella gelatinilytica]